MKKHLIKIKRKTIRFNTIRLRTNGTSDVTMLHITMHLLKSKAMKKAFSSSYKTSIKTYSAKPLLKQLKSCGDFYNFILTNGFLKKLLKSK